MSGWIECPTPGCPGDMRYAAPGRGHIPGCTAPVSASDARPPSDTGTTGWHRHIAGYGPIYHDSWCVTPSGEVRHRGSHPVLVVDPAEARESGIAAVHALEAREPDPSVEQYVDAVLAALAESDVRSDTGSASDPVSKKKKGHW